MRVHDHMLECVFFVCDRQQYCGGTGFFVALRDQNTLFSYFVTAAHCVHDARKEGGEVHIRMNTTDGPPVFMQTIDDNWRYGENSADVAVLPAWPPRNARSCLLDIEGFATDEFIAKHRVREGDELSFAGLFLKRPGVEQSLPILRNGVIAAMPSEPLINPRTGEKYFAYLAEVRSIGGLSGAPVYVVLTMDRPDYKDSGTYPGQHRILGVMQGHWDFELPLTEADWKREELYKHNSGIAIITPIQEVAKILYGEEFVKQRRKEAAERKAKDQPTLDSAFDDAPRPGIEPERLRIEGTPEEAVKRMFKKGKPSEGDVL